LFLAGWPAVVGYSTPNNDLVGKALSLASESKSNAFTSRGNNDGMGLSDSDHEFLSANE
jgi:hypothetical protein